MPKSPHAGFTAKPISSPSDPLLDGLCHELAGLASQWKSTANWPSHALSLCAKAGVFRWFLPQTVGGVGWSDADQIRGYLRLAAADLTTTFVITQFIGACKRIAGCEQAELKARWLPDLLSGRKFATVGISHLTTSRQYLGTPVLQATIVADGYLLNGMSPWVTGAAHADVIVLAATLPDGRELLFSVPTDAEGLRCGAGTELIALSASCTDSVTLDNVHVRSELVIAGPAEGVLRSGSGAGTGGLQTSALAVGLARAAVDFLTQESERRQDLLPIARQLDEQTMSLANDLIGAVSGQACDAGQLRGSANRLVMRTTQAAMTAAKGAGYVEGHCVGRWCREALFFLVWSCPQPVANEHLCELAGIEP